MNKLLLALLSLPTIAIAQDYRMPPSWPAPNLYPQQVYVQPQVAVVPIQPLNNLDRQVILQYQLEATENLQLRNDALRQHIIQDSSGFAGLDPSTGQDKGKFEIIGY